MIHWSDRFVGLPHLEFGRTFAGIDCWGLATLVYRDQLGIELPDYVLAYASADERAELAAILSGATASPIWREINPPATTTAFDIAIFRRGRLDSHVGIVVREGLMLHTVDGDCSKIETYSKGTWSHRLTGIYRHAARMNDAT